MMMAEDALQESSEPQAYEDDILVGLGSQMADFLLVVAQKTVGI